MRFDFGYHNKTPSTQKGRWKVKFTWKNYVEQERFRMLTTVAPQEIASNMVTEPHILEITLFLLTTSSFYPPLN